MVPNQVFVNFPQFLKLLDFQINLFILIMCSLKAYYFIDLPIRMHKEKPYYLLIHFYSLNFMCLDLLDVFKLFLALNYYQYLYLEPDYLDLVYNFSVCYFLIIMFKYYCSLFSFHPSFELMIEYPRINQLYNQMQSLLQVLLI